jgi:hypothetical protein
VRRNLRRRFWADIGLGSITGFLLLITAVFPHWIEFASGWAPDGHDGSLERLIVAGLSLATMLLFGVAAMEWHRAAAERSS